MLAGHQGAGDVWERVETEQFELVISKLGLLCAGILYGGILQTAIFELGFPFH